MAEAGHRKARIIAVVASTGISLACGTNYAYSAWAPQFAERMHLSATQSNVIGTAANIGMYASGIPCGLLVDSKGPKAAALLGAFALGIGYFPLKLAFDGGPGSLSIAILCIFSAMTGLGSCSAFLAAVKVSTINWPLHRGTATAFPLAAFGLSALFFTFLSSFAFPDDTSGLLLFLSLGTFGLTFVNIPFLRVPHPAAYQALATAEPRPFPTRRDSNALERTTSWQSKHSASKSSQEPSEHVEQQPDDFDPNADEASSLLSSAESTPGDIDAEDPLSKPEESHNSHHPDITGWALLPHFDFWQLFYFLGSLAGVGLMTINNIGHDAQALWTAYDPDTNSHFMQKIQFTHVCTISFCSFLGRLLSGVGSDIIVKRLHKSRFWCIVASSSIFSLAQLAALVVWHPHLLWAVSGLTGLGYGFLFGVFPALVADAFGLRGLSLNWGAMTLSPVIGGNIFNLAYGRIYDAHSVVEGADRKCEVGLDCYRSAYVVTLVVSLAGVVASLWSAWRDDRKRRRERDMNRERLREA